MPSTTTSLLPPKSLREAQFLAALGSQALDVLPHDARRATNVTVACMQALAMLQTRGDTVAESLLLAYAKDIRTPVKQAYQKIQDEVATWKPVSFWYTVKDLHWLDRIFRVEQLAEGETICVIYGARSLEGVHYLAQSDFYRQRVQIRNLESADITPLAVFADLLELELYRCDQVADLSIVAQLEQLHTLNLRECKKIIDLSPLARLAHLQNLNLAGSAKIASLAPLARLQNLRRLELTGCIRITDLAPLAGLSNLEEIEFAQCKRLVDLTPLAGLYNLRSLNLSWGALIEDISPLAGLSKLETLNISRCKKVRELSANIRWPNLKILNLAFCERIKSFAVLAHSPHLEELEAPMAKVVDIGPLGGLSHLRKLDLYLALHIEDLSPLANLTALEVLKISKGRIDPAIVKDLLRLREISFTFCYTIKTFTSFVHLHELEQIDLTSGMGLEDLTGVADLEKLTDLNLTACRNLMELAPLLEGDSLRKVTLPGHLRKAEEAKTLATRGVEVIFYDWE